MTGVQTCALPISTTKSNISSYKNWAVTAQLIRHSLSTSPIERFPIEWKNQNQSNHSSQSHTRKIEWTNQNSKWITCSWRKARENACASDWMKKWRCKEPSKLPPTILLACGSNRELWNKPFRACAKDADCVKPDGQNSVISFVISKWSLPELSF